MVKNFRHPQRPKKSSLVISPPAVIAAIRSGVQLDRIYIDPKLHNKAIDEVKVLASRQGIPVNYVPAAKLDGFNVPDHGGCVAQIA